MLPPPLALVYVNRLEPLVAYVKKLYEEISPVSVLRHLVPGLRFLLFPDSFVAVPRGRMATLVWLLFSFLLPLSWKVCVCRGVVIISVSFPKTCRPHFTLLSSHSTSSDLAQPSPSFSVFSVWASTGMKSGNRFEGLLCTWCHDTSCFYTDCCIESLQPWEVSKQIIPILLKMKPLTERPACMTQIIAVRAGTWIHVRLGFLAIPTEKLLRGEIRVLEKFGRIRCFIKGHLGERWPEVVSRSVADVSKEPDSY